MGQIVGHVAALNRFPVKSMAGEALEAAEIDWQGMEGDRQWALLFQGDTTRFPWCTGRDLSSLVLHRAGYADPARPKTSPVEVTAPDGWHGDLTDPALIARLSGSAGRPLSLLQLGIGCYDAMPVSIVTTAGHKLVEAAHGSPLDLRRFRVNIVVDSDVPESEWRGRRLTFGEEDAGAALLVTDNIPRCAMTTIDPDSGVRDPAVLRTIAQRFGNGYGVYASTARKGAVRVGDAVRAMD